MSRHQNLDPSELRQGIVIASTGNAAVALAMAARSLGAERDMQIPVHAVVPCDTSSMKTQMLREQGAQIIVHGHTLDDATRMAESIATNGKLVLVSLSNHSSRATGHMIAGYATVAVEILRQHRGPIDAIFVPVGSGALLTGIAAYTRRVSPQTLIIAVKPLPSGGHESQTLWQAAASSDAISENTLSLSMASFNSELHAHATVCVNNQDIASAIHQGMPLSTFVDSWR